MLVLTWSFNQPVAASTKELSVQSISSNVLMYEFFFANFLSSLSLVFVGNFFAYSISTVLFSCCLVDMPNAALCITSYLWLNVTRGSCADIWMFCNLVAAFVVLGMSE